MDFETRRSLYMGSLAAYLRRQGPLCLLTDTPGNTGDRLIQAGTMEALADQSIPYEPLALAGVGAAGGSGETLLVPGSGAFDVLWHEWLPETVIRASRGFGKVIILPSSFDPSVPIVAECLSAGNVYAFAREPASYRAIRVFGRAALSFDLALSAVRTVAAATAGEPAPEPGSLLLALREDKASLLPDYGVRPDPLLNEDVSSAITDLTDWLRRIAHAETVVTDRLHVVVAATLLARRVVYLDPRARKISTWVEYAFRQAYEDTLTTCSVVWLRAQGYVRDEEQGA